MAPQYLSWSAAPSRPATPTWYDTANTKSTQPQLPHFYSVCSEKIPHAAKLNSQDGSLATICRVNCYPTSIVHNMNPVHRCEFWSLPIWGRVLKRLWRAGHFLPHIIHTRTPTAPIWNIFNGIDSLIKKNSIATKMKENRWVVGFYEDLSHIPMEITHHVRAYMHHVCLIQSISARKATNLKLGICSGSSQCQLQFGKKNGVNRMKWLWVAAFWMQKCVFSGIPLLAPSRIFRETVLFS